MLTQTDDLAAVDKTLRSLNLQHKMPISLPNQMIQIRHGVLADAEDLQQLLSEPSVAHGLHNLPYLALDELRDRFSQPSSQGCLLVACYHNEIVGMVDLCLAADPRRRHGATVQWLAVHPDWQGLGIGDRLLRTVINLADHWCNIYRLELQVFADNHRAIALYKKLGFRDEGTLKKYACRDGQYCDVKILARLR